MLSRRSFLGALAGLPVLGHVLQRAPLPTDLPTVTNGFSQAERDILAYPFPGATLTSTSGPATYYNVSHVAGYGVVSIGPGRPWNTTG